MPNRGDWEWILTCEHGGNRIPRAYAYLFERHLQALQTHRGYDPGALEMARDFAKKARAPLFYSQTSRLLIELNRSLHHPHLFSDYTRSLPQEEKIKIIEKYYLPYRLEVERAIARSLKRKRSVVHLSFHSFTPVLDGVVRKGDIGLLYDPRRPLEKSFCQQWKASLQRMTPFRVRFNYPYLGKADGFATYLRSLYGQRKYIGIEIEVNQRFFFEDPQSWKEIKRFLWQSILENAF